MCKIKLCSGNQFVRKIIPRINIWLAFPGCNRSETNQRENTCAKYSKINIDIIVWSYFVQYFCLKKNIKFKKKIIVHVQVNLVIILF